MAEQTQVAVAAGRSHIIERPRLTRLLDEATSRVILLVAPAGYGKTTLARQWLESRPHAWYRGTPASADVAALAFGFAECAKTLLPAVGTRIRDGLTSMSAPEEEAAMLAELLTEDFDSWPEDAWFVFDDYHCATESHKAEVFVDAVIAHTSARFLIVSRRRPSWCTARRMLYGDIYEVDRTALAMTVDEAELLLSRGSETSGLNLVRLADGWPAVLGLAALLDKPDVPVDELSRALYDYFAEELYHEAPRTLRRNLFRLALLPVIDADVVRLFINEPASRVMAQGVRTGFLTSDRAGGPELHPLLRAFLIRKLRDDAAAGCSALVHELGEILLAHERWDDAYILLSEFPDRGLITRLLREGSPALFERGRLESVGRWLALAENHQLREPAIDFVEAELALRHGFSGKAEALARTAIQSMGANDGLRVQGLPLAGASAHLSDRYELAAEYYRAALQAVTKSEDRASALWGLFLASHYLELPHTTDVLTELEAMGDSSPHTVLRLANARLHDACRANHNLFSALEQMEYAAHLVSRVADPSSVASFVQSYAYALLLTGNYERSLAVSAEGLAAAEERGIRFVYPVALCVQAFASLGLHEFSKAETLIDRAEMHAAEVEDAYSLLNARTARAKLFLAQRRYVDAVEITERVWRRTPSRALVGEYLATRALALLGAGKAHRALEIVERADATTSSVETRTLTSFARAIAAEDDVAGDARDPIIKAFARASHVGHVDGIVTTYRSFPAITDILAREHEGHANFLEIIAGAGDQALLARESRQYRAPSGSHLSKRESEVYELLGQGLSNREIATELFISEVTVKVHVRHILKKFGARSRVEAVIKGLSDGG